MLCSRVSVVARLGLLGVLAGAAALLPNAARAADIYPGEPGGYGRTERYERYERYEPAPYPRETSYPRADYRPRVLRPPAPILGEADGYCRVRHVRRVDPYGREVVRRLRVCDEGVVAERPAYEPRPRYSRGYGYSYEQPRRVYSRPVEPVYDQDYDD